jgi:hypothetical protein
MLGQQVKNVYEITETMKTNLRQAQEQLASYNKPLLIRKPKPIAKDEFEREHKAMVKEQYHVIKEGASKKIR